MLLNALLKRPILLLQIYLFRNTHMMVSRLVLSAVFVTLGFLTCLLVQSLIEIRHQGFDLGRFSIDLGHLSGNSGSLGQQHPCDQADRLFALLSG